MKHRTLTQSVCSTHEAYHGAAIAVLDKIVRLPDGSMVHRDVVTYPGGAVGVLALTEDQRIVLVRQYRPTSNALMLEIPAGRRNVGESFLAAARRELREETGYTASLWTRSIGFWPSPGILDERIVLYVAQGLTKGDQSLDDDEFIRSAVIPMDEILDRCRRGTIVDAKTIVGVLWYARFGTQ
jgi:ADP-ribose pyrophosphatase